MQDVFTVEAMKDTLTALVFLAFIGLLAWSRYLSHKETIAFVEKGGDWSAFAEMKELGRMRTGIMIGVVLAAIGIAFLAAITRVTPAAFPGGSDAPIIRFAFTLVGAMFAGVGALLILANLLWARYSANRLRNNKSTPPPKLPEQTE